MSNVKQNQKRHRMKKGGKVNQPQSFTLKPIVTALSSAAPGTDSGWYGDSQTVSGERNHYKKCDRAPMSISVKHLHTDATWRDDNLVDGQHRFRWVIPQSTQTKAGQQVTVHHDSRGEFVSLDKVVIKFRNDLDDTLRVLCTTPVSQLGDSLIAARAKIAEFDLRPRAVRKYVVKSFGDKNNFFGPVLANLKTGENDIAQTLILADIAARAHTINDRTGLAYNVDRVALNISIQIYYTAAPAGPIEPALTNVIRQRMPINITLLPSLAAVLWTDPKFLQGTQKTVKGIKGVSVPAGEPTWIVPEADNKKYMRADIVKILGNMWNVKLTHCNENGEQVDDLRLPAFQEGGMRLVCPAMAIVYDSIDRSAVSTVWKYNENHDAWLLVDDREEDGFARYYDPRDELDQKDMPLVDRRTPMYVYSISDPRSSLAIVADDAPIVTASVVTDVLHAVALAGILL